MLYLFGIAYHNSFRNPWS